MKQRFFDNAARKLRVGAGDTLFAYVYINAANPPKELMLQWHTKGNWTHRAYWGANLIDFGKDGTPERLRLGDLPATGRWTRLEVPVEKLELAPGTVDRRLGIHPVRRYRLLGQSRNRNRDAPGWAAL